MKRFRLFALLVVVMAITSTLSMINIFGHAVKSEGKGLKGEYYKGTNFDQLELIKFNQQIKFNWSLVYPDKSLGYQNYSVRWTGHVEPLFSEAYTFYTKSDDGVRLWVNDQLLIDNWKKQKSTETSANISLEAGQLYTIKIEYYQKKGLAEMVLKWSSKHQKKQVIPKCQLYYTDPKTTPTLVPTIIPSATAQVTTTPIITALPTVTPTPVPTVVPTSIPTPMPTIKPDNDIIDLSFIGEITDCIQDPSKSQIYIVDKLNKKLISVNLNSQEILEATFELPPERVAYFNNELYVTLLKMNHDSYEFDESKLKGRIAVLDSNSLTMRKQFDIDTDPYDITLDNSGNVYIPSGSSQWTDIKSYSALTNERLSISGIRQQSYIDYNPVLNRLYTITTDSSPRDYTAYNISNTGEFKETYDSPYHGDYSLAQFFKISPDGKYLFNGAGTIFTCSESRELDMQHIKSMKDGFSDIAFDIKNNKFYTNSESGVLSEYNYDIFEKISSINYSKALNNIFFYNNELFAITSSTNYLNSTYKLEKITNLIK